MSIATETPEIGTTVTAAWGGNPPLALGNYSMAVSNIFGSNAVMVARIFLAALFYLDSGVFLLIHE